MTRNGEEPPHIEQPGGFDAQEAPDANGGVVVLVVDDQELVIGAVKRILQRAGGFTVVSTTSPLEALKLVKSLPHLGETVMDVMMPEMNGVELAQRVHALRPDLPILHMTASPEAAEELMERAGWLGPVVHKPFESEQLLSSLKRLLT